jgi:hypothetical protein
MGGAQAAVNNGQQQPEDCESMVNVQYITFTAAGMVQASQNITIGQVASPTAAIVGGGGRNLFGAAGSTGVRKKHSCRRK